MLHHQKAFKCQKKKKSAHTATRVNYRVYMRIIHLTLIYSKVKNNEIHGVTVIAALLMLIYVIILISQR